MDELVVEQDAAAVARSAGGMVARAIREAVSERGEASLVLAGGSTPKAMYAWLASGGAGEVPWDRVQVYFGDERCVGPEHADSNYRMASEAMLSKVPARVCRIAGELGAARAAAMYADLLPKAPPGEPMFDVVLLGMGADGHTASLFPGHDFAGDAGRLVTTAKAPEGFAVRDRVSLTLGALGASRLVLAMITGADKAGMLARVRGERSGGAARLPMSMVRPGGVRFVADRAAAGG
jgi:6-phosphogluconolactonase